ncbi:MAG: site-2 protease family protein [Candidatus Saccharimonas sp.]|nr:site-2 protease family protein [Planctomycetaceae bacterium]
MDGNDLLARVMWFIPVLLSLTVHEWAHAWTAWKLGDDTARLMGRLSLNPLVHMDPIGTFLLPLMGVPFGWAKPVPVNPLRFRRDVTVRGGMLLVAVAGPISNVCIALVSWLLLFVLVRTVPVGDHPELESVIQLLVILVAINIGLAMFNMIPIPPLDGSKVVDALVPDSARPAWNQFCALGPVLLIAVILLPQLTGFSPIGEAINAVLRLVLSTL